MKNILGFVPIIKRIVSDEAAGDIFPLETVIDRPIKYSPVGKHKKDFAMLLCFILLLDDIVV